MEAPGSVRFRGLAARGEVPAGEPLGEARNDYDIFTNLARAYGVEDRFTEGRSEMAWLRHLYEGWRRRTTEVGTDVIPPFEMFWAAGIVQVTDIEPDPVLLRDFRTDTERAPLSTPSGRIEIFSKTIDSFGLRCQRKYLP